MKLTVVINADTRIGFDDVETCIADRGDNMLFGCRSVDFMTEGVLNKINFFQRNYHRNNGVEIEYLVVIDEVNPVPEYITSFLDNMKNNNLRYVIRKFEKERKKWNDHLYLDSLEMADCDYIAHFDQDTAAFCAASFDPAIYFVSLLDLNPETKFITIPMKNRKSLMHHASTRFFVCERNFLDIPHLRVCVDDLEFLYTHHRSKNYGRTHIPCLEFILGYIAGKEGVCFPEWNPDLYMIFCWSAYSNGVFRKYNDSPYSTVKSDIEEHVIGVNDVCARNL